MFTSKKEKNWKNWFESFAVFFDPQTVKIIYRLKCEHTALFLVEYLNFEVLLCLFGASKLLAQFCIHILHFSRRYLDSPYIQIQFSVMAECVNLGRGSGFSIH